jgi:hypothetical protein
VSREANRYLIGRSRKPAANVLRPLDDEKRTRFPCTFGELMEEFIVAPYEPKSVDVIDGSHRALVYGVYLK